MQDSSQRGVSPMTSEEIPDGNLVSPIFDSIAPEPLSLKDSPNTKPLQFETAEYESKSDVERCAQCNKRMLGHYYKLNGRRTCPTCLEQAKACLVNTESNYLHALIFGIGAAIVGLILYATFEIVTGLTIGYLSLAVGYIIAKAMMKGSKGVGGFKFQLTAVLLTYGAVSMAAVPVAIHQLSKEKGQTVVTADYRSPDINKPTVVTAQPEGKKDPGWLLSIGILLFIGLASPFLGLAEGINGIIGLVILFVGLQIAWRTTQGVELQILGPFNLKAKETP
jgi:hypothetical protein